MAQRAFLPNAPKSETPSSLGRGTSFAVLHVRLWGEDHDRMVDLVYDPTQKLHHIMVGLSEKRDHLRAIMDRCRPSAPETFNDAKYAYDKTMFNLAAIRREVLMRDQGRGRVEQRWSRAFVAAAAAMLPPDVLAKLESAASEAVNRVCTAAEVRP